VVTSTVFFFSGISPWGDNSLAIVKIAVVLPPDPVKARIGL